MATGVRYCKLCGTQLDKPSWILREMPASAQKFVEVSPNDDSEKTDLFIHQCDNCGLVQLANDPVTYFKEVIRATAFSKEMGIFRRDQFANFVERFSLNGESGIEIGCGRGEYLKLLSERGLKMTGLEYSDRSVAQCNAEGLRVYKGFIGDERLPLQDEKFASFYMFNYLEHLPFPIQNLRDISRLLSEDGVGLIEVPNFDMIVRERMFTEFCTDHILYFTEDTLRQMLSRSGFEVLSLDAIWGEYILSATVRIRPTFPTTDFSNAKKSLESSLNSFITSYDPESIAIWGAGHQALAVIAACKLQGKIKYVIDSAPFKQDKLTPGSFIPVRAPSVLSQIPPSALLIMAGAYSEEIARTIKSDYGDAFQVAILRGMEIEEYA